MRLYILGTAFLRITNAGRKDEYQNLKDDAYIFIAGNVTLACATSLITEERMLWSYQKDSLSNPMEQPRNIETTTGLSVFEANEIGFYSCHAKDQNGNVMIYSVLLIRLSEDIENSK